jgi:hypothetical protein|tara:strand:- start:169 stop:948 length:780 start_codon:yes stop_codon:yes gene_type:complete
MKREKIDSLIESGAEIIGTVSSTTIGFLFAGPVGAYVGAASSVPITNSLKKLGAEISEHIMGPREKARIGATYIDSIEKIKQRLDKGNSPREDDFFNKKIDDRSSADTILEGILQKAKNENEEKKLPFYSSFLCNLSFDDSIDFNRSITYLKIIDRLSYQQLCILSYVKDLEQIEFDNWNSLFINNQEAQTYLDFYYELVELFELNALRQFGNKSLGGPKNGELSSIGTHLYNLMGLSEINNEDKQNIENKISEINEIN